MDVIETDAFGAFGAGPGRVRLQAPGHRHQPGRRPHRPAGGRRLLHSRPAGWPATYRAPVSHPRPDPLPDLRGRLPAGLLAGGVDLLIIETVFDLLQAKSAMNAAPGDDGRRPCPLQVQVTIELTGTMLPGTEIGAALSALEAMDSTSSVSTAPPGRPRCSSRPPSHRPQSASGVPTQRRTAHRGRRGHALRPHPGSAGRSIASSSPSSGCDRGAVARPITCPVVERAPISPRRRAPRTRTGRPPSTARCPSTRTPPSW